MHPGLEPALLFHKPARIKHYKLEFLFEDTMIEKIRRDTQAEEISNLSFIWK
jgi:hypothetical protein